jgi:Raf kinase inhibitor-like YbhB/YbcL family protein
MAVKRALCGSALAALAFAAMFVIADCSKPAAHAQAPPVATMKLTSTAFEGGGKVPVDYTGDGKNISPPLAWEGVPDRAVTFALIMDDPDARMGPFVHWLICEILREARMLPEAIPKEENVTGPVSAVQGVNSFRTVGYSGPHPPKGETHRYVFRLYALDSRLEMPGGFSKKQLEEAMKDHILAQGTLVGKYGR